ncbi:MAG: family acetyltransferase, partial [Phycisphaerales bacterium]|nr:family acetyltransferase [Phycisphaerales bacterium]
MSSLWIHPLTLRGLSTLAMGRAFLRYRNPRRKASGRHQDEFYERTWREAAEELGGTSKRLNFEISEIEIDGFRTRVVHNVSEIDSPPTLAVLHDKPLTHRILREHGLCVPRHATFSAREMGQAVEFIRSTDGDCVVKPSGGTGGGRGVTTGIRKLSHLAFAAAHAAVYADQLLIEEQIEGENYRLLFLDGELLDSFVRRHPTVVGDGKSSVARLVELNNEKRLQSRAEVSQVLLTIDPDMRRTLAKQGLSLSAVPAGGRTVRVKTVINENSGADNETATPLLCQSIIADCARAVRALGVRFAGIDLITRDPGVPLAESGGVILEVNGTPNLYYHYKKKDGAFPVAV